MATLTPTLTLVSTDTSTDALSLSVTDSLTVTTPMIDIARITLAGDAAATTILDNNATTTYVYLKNTDTTATDYIYVYDDTSTGDPVILKLAGGDFAFLPLNADKTLRAYATTGGTILEYALFGTDQ